MGNIEAIFVDNGDVMNDNALRGPQWQRLVAEYLAPRMGGTRSAWAAANKAVVEKQIAEFLPGLHKGIAPEMDYSDFLVADDIQWLRGMCELVGVDAPEDDDRCVQIARDTRAYVTPQLRTAMPGAADAVRVLHAAGYKLHTASGEPFDQLEGELAAMDVRPLFDGLYGPDVVNTWKTGPLYYERIFAHSGVAPSTALVVDDKAMCAEWAMEAGASAVRVAAHAPKSPADYPVIRGLAELPALLDSSPDLSQGDKRLPA